MTVKDGRLVLPDGMSYRVLVLPNTPFMTPGLLARLRELVRQGATIIGPKPVKSPSLADYPECDTTVQKLAEEIWGNCDGRIATEHAFGNGRVIWGRSPEEVLAAVNVNPDCEFTTTRARPKMAWIHRAVGDADVYFISNQKPRSEDVDCMFRSER